MPPQKITQSFKPIKITQPRPGIYVADFGQNFSGWAKIRIPVCQNYYKFLFLLIFLFFFLFLYYFQFYYLIFNINFLFFVDLLFLFNLYL